MWQTVVVAVLFIGAAVYVARHFMILYRNGSECGCSGCSSRGCRAGKSPGADQFPVQEQPRQQPPAADSSNNGKHHLS